VSDILLGLSCPDTQTGTAVGALGIILKTTDGGQNWMRQPSGTNRDLYSVSFTDVNTGTTVGGYGAILRTTGPTPTPQPTLPPRPTPGATAPPRPTPPPRPGP
jgi:hypothetical protein